MATNITDISSTEFQNSPGRYLDESGKRPVRITKYGRLSRVLLDAEEYAHIKALSERYKTTAMHVSELDDAFIDGMLSETVPEEAEQYNDEFPAANL